MPGFRVEDRSIPDIQGFKTSSRKPTGHPAEKPIDLVEWILSTSSIGDGHVVLDPFCGSGTTGVAALRCGASFIGSELDEAWALSARARIGSGIAIKPDERTGSQSGLFEGAA